MAKKISREVENQLKVEKWLAGELSLAQLRGYTRDELVAVAEIGFAYFAQGKYEEATILFRGLSALEPEAAYPYKALGAIALAEQEFLDALGYWASAVGLAPDDPETYLGRAEACLGLGRKEDARSDLRRAIRYGRETDFGRRATAFLGAVMA